MFAAAIAVAAGVAMASPAEARTYKWCAQYTDDIGVLECAYNTLAQCQATVFGVGGFCKVNPRVQARGHY
jgi:hypothetical protein